MRKKIFNQLYASEDGGAVETQGLKEMFPPNDLDGAEEIRKWTSMLSFQDEGKWRMPHMFWKKALTRKLTETDADAYRVNMN